MYVSKKIVFDCKNVTPKCKHFFSKSEFCACMNDMEFNSCQEINRIDLLLFSCQELIVLPALNVIIPVSKKRLRKLDIRKDNGPKFKIFIEFILECKNLHITQGNENCNV